MRLIKGLIGTQFRNCQDAQNCKGRQPRTLQSVICVEAASKHNQRLCQEDLRCGCCLQSEVLNDLWILDQLAREDDWETPRFDPASDRTVPKDWAGGDRFVSCCSLPGHVLYSLG